MNTVELLDELQEKALADADLRHRLLATKQAKEPYEAFCAECQRLGYAIYPMDLVEAGEEFYATYRRSTNGGGENSPKLAGEDDFYEMFIATLEQQERKEQNAV